MPIIRQERPGMRLIQYNEALVSCPLPLCRRPVDLYDSCASSQYKDFQKSPDNPFNQVSVAYNATKQDKVDALGAVRDEATSRSVSDWFALRLSRD